MLEIYDTLTRSKRQFQPIHPPQVSMYVCGITVYDYCHLGHARTYVAFDYIHRYLDFLGYEVKYVRNITDMDNKIFDRAALEYTTCEELTQHFTNIMHQDFADLGLLKPTIEPLASQTIEHMQHIIQDLLTKGVAYIGINGDVFYDITKYAAYGELAHKDLTMLQAGARVEKNPAKHNPLDFVLWKVAPTRDLTWPSPWGNGTPGWHIECSAMADLHIGASIDIHGGGFDLQFPHHENERAQSEIYTGKKFVNYWLHTGFLNIKNAKMSKSLHNFMTIRDVLREYHPEILRYFFANSHYRSEVNFKIDMLLQAKMGLLRLYGALRDLNLATATLNLKQLSEAAASHLANFTAAMDDDFNTPVAFTVLFALAHQINNIKTTNQPLAIELGLLLRKLAGIFGILQQNVDMVLQQQFRVTPIVNQEALLTETDILQAIREREAARLQRNWSLADQIRATLLAKGIVLEDAASGTTWHRR